VEAGSVGGSYQALIRISRTTLFFQRRLSPRMSTSSLSGFSNSIRRYPSFMQMPGIRTVLDPSGISPGKCPDPTSGRKRGAHAIFVTRWLYSTVLYLPREYAYATVLLYLPHEYVRGAEHVPARLALVEVQPLYSRKEFGRCQCSVSPHPSTGSLWT
jgi:hypothetical protein